MNARFAGTDLKFLSVSRGHSGTGSIQVEIPKSPGLPVFRKGAP